MNVNDKVYELYCGGMTPVVVIEVKPTLQGKNKVRIQYPDGRKRTVTTDHLMPAAAVSEQSKELYGRHEEK